MQLLICSPDASYYQLACFPHMATTPIRAHYSAHRWSADPQLFKAWQRGKTG
jgi:deoxyribodipyrimidine photolyase